MPTKKRTATDFVSTTQTGRFSAPNTTYVFPRPNDHSNQII